MRLGCIGDDFTGSSDLGNTLAKTGFRTVQYCGVPEVDADPSVDAGVVALKSRSIPADDAIALSLSALDWLLAQGCTQIFFKYCSTFDSTAEGNIGPVAKALADRLDAERVIFCPTFPATGRTVFQGHLFVNDRLLSESGMQNHPLTPMTDPDLRRWLAAQTDQSVGHVPYATVYRGTDPVRAALQEATARFVIMDAITEDDLRTIGQAVSDAPLITGGSGLAMGLTPPEGGAEAYGDWTGESGLCVALSGSCSEMTRAQIKAHLAGNPGLEIEAEAVISGEMNAAKAASWAVAQDGIPLVYSSADPAKVRAVQEKLGRDASAETLEAFFADTARALVGQGVRKIITAGGETSGAVVEGLDVAQLEIGPQICAGVPAVRATPALLLALKSGNFGDEGFFESAAASLDHA